MKGIEMANCITLDNKIILRCSNCAMSFFYENMLATAIEEHLDNNIKLMDFLVQFDQNIYGLGCVELEITKIFDSIEIAKLFQQLIEKTTEKIKRENAGSLDSIERFEQFKNDLIKWMPDK